MRLAIILFAVLLSGCSTAGITTVWRFQMDMGYATPQEKPAAPARAGTGI
jgi:hypothetical protein